MSNQLKKIRKIDETIKAAGRPHRIDLVDLENVIGGCDGGDGGCDGGADGGCDGGGGDGGSCADGGSCGVSDSADDGIGIAAIGIAVPTGYGGYGEA